VKTELWAMGVVLFCAVLGSIGQILLKLGSASVSFQFMSWITNLRLIGGISMYAVASILFIFAIKHGNLSILYPLVATSYIWVAILSVRFLGEPFAPVKWIGIALIVSGVCLIAYK